MTQPVSGGAPQSCVICTSAAVTVPADRCRYRGVPCDPGRTWPSGHAADSEAVPFVRPRAVLPGAGRAGWGTVFVGVKTLSSRQLWFVLSGASDSGHKAMVLVGNANHDTTCSLWHACYQSLT